MGGDRLSVDECCLASKVFIGHVESLAGRCDAVFVPCYPTERPPQRVLHEVPVGHRYGAQHLPATTSCASSPARGKIGDGEDGAAPLVSRRTRAQRLGASYKDATTCVQARQCTAQERNPAPHGGVSSAGPPTAAGGDDAVARPLGILVVAHPAFPTIRTSPARSSIRSRRWAPRSSTPTPWITSAPTRRASEFSGTMPWIINRELIGSVLLAQDSIDGIILISAFPCGPTP